MNAITFILLGFTGAVMLRLFAVGRETALIRALEAVQASEREAEERAKLEAVDLTPEDMADCDVQIV